MASMDRPSGCFLALSASAPPSAQLTLKTGRQDSGTGQAKQFNFEFQIKLKCLNSEIDEKKEKELCQH